MTPSEKPRVERCYETYCAVGKTKAKKFYIDNVGRISEIIGGTDFVAGDDLYLSLSTQICRKATYLALRINTAIVRRMVCPSCCIFLVHIMLH